MMWFVFIDEQLAEAWYQQGVVVVVVATNFLVVEKK